MLMMTHAELAARICTELSTALQSVSEADVDALREAILGAKRIYITGKGRTGLQMRAFAMRLMHAGLTVHVIDDVTTPAINAGDLLIIGSGSGATSSLVQYAVRTKALKAQIALITAAPTSSIAQEANVVLRIVASSPKIEGSVGSFQPMANLFEQSLLIVLDILIMQIMDKLNLTSEQMFTRHANLE
jgi:6-phospho-3-hexuloisomerase